MLAKKKKNEQRFRSTAEPSFCYNGLFAPKASREHLLEQLKKGTLFHSGCRSSPDRPSEDLGCRGEECWLSLIKLGQEGDPSQVQLPKANADDPLKPAKKHLPVIEGRPVRESHKFKNTQTRSRYNKMACLQQQLNTTGAWNKQNCNGIDNNLSKLAVALKRRPEDLTKNDFGRVAGLTYHDRSIDQSILSLSTDLMVLSSNPFGNLSFVGSAGETRNRRDNKLWKSLRKKRHVESQGHFIPGFLMSSLVVQKTEHFRDR